MSARKQKQLTAKDIRRMVTVLEKRQIPPEPCGCIKYTENIRLTCEVHTVPLTKSQIAKAIKNIEWFGQRKKRK